MILAYAGEAFLALALLFAFGQAVRFKHLSPFSLSCSQLLGVTLAILLFFYAHITDNFSLLSVVLHSHTQKPFLYKVAGIWGNHEGSMLLWVWLLCGYGAALSHAMKDQALPCSTTLPLMGIINFGFLLFMLMVCDPFVLMDSPPLQGQDLNPVLQDPSLAIHPPLLYLGYAGFTIPFVLAVAVLIHGTVPDTWASHLRTWAIWAWTFLTLGVALGSLWAYYELGWGGWWFWDPVENVALMPWLSATALLHTLQVARTTKALNAWTIFLCILTFALCLGGTFFVRSGLLTSVHSFALDAERGLFILVLFSLLVFPALGLFIWRFSAVRSTQSTVALSRSGFILLMTLILICGTATVALGTFYPLILEVFNKKMTVGNPYFNATFIPMMIPILALVGLAPWYGWKDLPPSHVRWLVPLLCGTLVIVLGLYAMGVHHTLGLAAFAGAVWTILATLGYAIKKRKIFSGMILSHLGIGIAILGMVGVSLGEREIVKAIRVGETFHVGPASLTLQKVMTEQGPNYNAQRAVLQLNQTDVLLMPEKRAYWTQKVMHGESAIRSVGWLGQVYVTLGDEYEGQQWSIHAYYKPYINLLWIGALITVLGGLVAFAKRFSWIKNILPLLVLISPTLAMSAHEQLKNPVLEARARSLSQRILCPVCQGQTLDESPIPAAVALRAEIRQALTKGQTDAQILEAFVRRYGDQVVITSSGTFLWWAPWIIFGMLVVGFLMRVVKKS